MKNIFRILFALALIVSGQAYAQSASTFADTSVTPSLVSTVKGNSSFNNLLGSNQLPHWNAALSRVMAKQGNARVLFIGDSTMAGYYSTNSASGPYAQLSIPALFSNALNGMGIPSNYDAVLGAGANLTDKTTLDGRLTVGTGWATFGGGTSGTMGGQWYSATSATTPIAFTPNTPVDTFKLWYISTPGAGSMNCNVDNGTNTAVNQAATANYLSTTIAAPLGKHTFYCNWGSGAGGVIWAGVEASNSALSAVLIDNGGWPSSTAPQWASATGGAYSAISACTKMNYDLVVIDLGDNDIGTGVTLSAYTTALQTIASSCQASGVTDVVFMTGFHENPSYSANYSEANQALYAAAMKTVATSTSNSSYVQGTPVADEFSNLVSYAYENNVGGIYAASSIHANYITYGTMARDLVQQLVPVGNAAGGYQSFSTVGIGTSSPTTALSVNGSISTTPTTITASATPVISTTSGLQTVTLSTNAAPTISGIAVGQRISLEICQPSSGGPYTWTWPAAIHGGMTIGTTASTCSIQAFDSLNGTSLVAESAGIASVAP